MRVKVHFQRESFPKDFPDHAGSRRVFTDVVLVRRRKLGLPQRGGQFDIWATRLIYLSVGCMVLRRCSSVSSPSGKCAILDGYFGLAKTLMSTTTTYRFKSESWRVLFTCGFLKRTQNGKTLLFNASGRKNHSTCAWNQIFLHEKIFQKFQLKKTRRLSTRWRARQRGENFL